MTLSGIALHELELFCMVIGKEAAYRKTYIFELIEDH